MLLSGLETEGRPALVGLAVAQDRVEDVDASSGQGDHGLAVPFAFASLAVVVDPRGGIVLDRAEGRLVEDPFEGLVAAGRAPGVADLAGLPQDRGQPAGGSEGIAAGKAVDAADGREELRGEGGPHSRQAEDEGPVRMGGHQLVDLVFQGLQLKWRGRGISHPSHGRQPA